MQKQTVILISIDFFKLSNNQININLISNFNKLINDGYFVCVLSNKIIPQSIKNIFKENNFYIQDNMKNRQNKSTIQFLISCIDFAYDEGLKNHNIVVLAHKIEDIQMAKHAHAIIVSPSKSSVSQYGICVSSQEDLQYILNILESWSGEWWFKARKDPDFEIYSLLDLSTFNKQQELVEFLKCITDIIKNNKSYTFYDNNLNINSILALTSISILKNFSSDFKNLIFGVYPSSNSDNSDNETLSDFTHKLRSIVSNVQYCKKGEPLFIRHKPSLKRSNKYTNLDRTDPTEQINSIHINPFYKDKIKNKHVFVIDDCTTYGVSLSVSYALLKKAGAEKVTGITLGKFGDRLEFYDIEILSNPYEPINCFKCNGKSFFDSITFTSNQNIKLIETLTFI